MLLLLPLLPVDGWDAAAYRISCWRRWKMRRDSHQKRSRLKRQSTGRPSFMSNAGSRKGQSGQLSMDLHKKGILHVSGNESLSLFLLCLQSKMPRVNIHLLKLKLYLL